MNRNEPIISPSRRVLRSTSNELSSSSTNEYPSTHFSNRFSWKLYPTKIANGFHCMSSLFLFSSIAMIYLVLRYTNALFNTTFNGLRRITMQFRHFILTASPFSWFQSLTSGNQDDYYNSFNRSHMYRGYHSDISYPRVTELGDQREDVVDDIYSLWHPQRRRIYLIWMLLLLPLIFFLIYFLRPLTIDEAITPWSAAFLPSDRECSKMFALHPIDKSFTTRITLRGRCLVQSLSTNKHLEKIVYWYRNMSFWRKESDLSRLANSSTEFLPILESLSAEIDNLESAIEVKLNDIYDHLGSMSEIIGSISSSLNILKSDSSTKFEEFLNPTNEASSMFDDFSTEIRKSLSDLQNQLTHLKDTKDALTAVSSQEQGLIIEQIAKRASALSLNVIDEKSKQIIQKLKTFLDSPLEDYASKLTKIGLVLAGIQNSMATQRVELESQLDELRKDRNLYKQSVMSILSEYTQTDINERKDDLSIMRQELLSLSKKQSAERIEDSIREVDAIKVRLLLLENICDYLDKSVMNLTKDFKEILATNSASADKLFSLMKEKIDSAVTDIGTSLNEELSANLRQRILTEIDLDDDKSDLKKRLLLLIKKTINDELKSAIKDSAPHVGVGTAVQIRAVVDDALDRFSNDRIGLADYAQESAGGRVVSTRCTKSYTKGDSVIRLFGISLAHVRKSPNTMLQPGNHPGECWAFEGSVGQVIIKLAMPIYITGVSLEHIPKSIALAENIDSAPRDFFIKTLESEDADEGEFLGSFTYNSDGTPIQYFPIEIKSITKPASFVEFGVQNNYGNERFTCIYRLRVHGTVKKPTSS